MKPPAEMLLIGLDVAILVINYYLYYFYYYYCVSLFGHEEEEVFKRLQEM